MGRRRAQSGKVAEASAGASPALPGTPPSARPNRAIFTIASANYIAYAATLMQSVREHHPDVSRFIILADAPREFPRLDLAAELLPCTDISIPLLANMALWYTTLEFNTAIKPFAFRYLLEDQGFNEVCYLDPDILLFAPLTHVWQALEQSEAVLTPHITEPLPEDGYSPSDHTLLKSGVYNLGFAAFRRTERTAEFIKWWAERCTAHCRVDTEANLFTDQRWMDFAPAFIEKLHILRHPGHNVAYWNLPHRSLTKDGSGRILVNGKDLIFYHFSGLVIDNASLLSRHENRYLNRELGLVGEICAQYRNLVLANEWKKTKDIPWAFGFFPDGRPIEAAMRRWLLRAIDEGRIAVDQPLSIASDFFDAVDEGALGFSVRLTRFMYQLWLDRSDLKAVFDIRSEAGRDAYFRWFFEGPAEKEGIDPRSIAAVRRLLRPAEALPSPSPVAKPPPWPALSLQSWSGPAARAMDFLAGDVIVTIDKQARVLPRQAALAWELRPDLQAHFPLDDEHSLREFQGWVLTSAIAEGAVEPDLFSNRFVNELTQRVAISQFYNDVPITEGMLLTKNSQAFRNSLPGWQSFPSERTGRLAHGLWFRFRAAKCYRWPKALTEPLAHYFAELTDISCGETFRLNRAERAFWEIRPDVQQAFPLLNEESRWQFLHWITTHGLQELGLTLDDVDPRLRNFLAKPSSMLPGLPMAIELVFHARPDIAARHDPQTEAGRTSVIAWAKENYADFPLGEMFTEEQSAPAVVKPGYSVPLALTGEWSAVSGRGEDIRTTAMALRAAGCENFAVVDRKTSRVLRADGSVLDSGMRLEVENNIVLLNAVTALSDALFLRAMDVHAAYSIGYWAWELEWLPRAWRHAFSFYDEIWAASNFARDAFAKSGLRPVRLMPMAVSLPKDPIRKDRAAFGLPEEATVFLFMFDFRSYASRKNPEAVIAAFQKAFPKGNENVRLLLKTHGGETAPDAWERLRQLAADPRILIRDMVLERGETVNLLASTDAFVSLHRSEGFGRGPAEAMLLARPVIATAYSGVMDFLSSDCAYLVGYKLVPVAASDYIGVEGQSWAEPDIEEAAAHMRAVYEDPEQARILALRGRERIQTLYHPARVGAALLAALARHSRTEPSAEKTSGPERSGAPQTAEDVEPLLASSE